MTAPAARSRSATAASRGAMEVASAREPALVCIRSAVSMLSLISTGMPCRGPRGPRERRSASIWSAMARASGFRSRTAPRVGPRRSRASIRARYSSARARGCPAAGAIPSWSWATVSSSELERLLLGCRRESGGGGLGAGGAGPEAARRRRAGREAGGHEERRSMLLESVAGTSRRQCAARPGGHRSAAGGAATRIAARRAVRRRCRAQSVRGARPRRARGALHCAGASQRFGRACA